MKALEIFGGKPLKGEVCISGAKNASMPIIIASIIGLFVAIFQSATQIQEQTLQTPYHL